MKNLTVEDLNQLATAEGTCVSIYLPMEEAGRDVQQNRIRFKNAMKEAISSIDKEANPELFGKLSKLEKQEHDDEFWQHQSEGLAIFVNAEQSQEFTLNFAVSTMCVVDSLFELRPACEAVQSDGRYYVLAVSQNQVRLFGGTQAGLAEIEASDLPEDLESALNIDEYVSSLQHHSTRSKSDGTVYHGQGGSNQDVQKSDELLQYFRRINNALQSYFGVERTPLVFAGVEYLFPIFKESCDYNELIEEPVIGNPDEKDAEQLHEQSWPLIEPVYDRKRQQALEEYGAALAHSQASNDLDKIRELAEQGAIAQLIVKTVSENSSLSDASDQHVRKAVIHTLRNGGLVFCDDSEEISDSVAAILRYPLPASTVS